MLASLSRKTSVTPAILRITGSVAAQAVSPIANVLTSIVVARSLGPAGLGFFAVCLSVMQFLVSMQTVWVGDAYTVLDRSDSDVLNGVSLWELLHLAVGAMVAAPVAVFAFGLEWAPGLMLSALVAAWELEEFGRRTFMAHKQFRMQGLSDLLYAFLALSLLLVLEAMIGLSLTMVLGSMTIAAVASFVFNQVTAPPGGGLRLPRPSARALTVVASYGSWRAAQAGSAYLTQLGLRYAVVALVSIKGMGELEAARLVAAPMFTVLGASTNLLLPHFVQLRGRGYGALRIRLFGATTGITLIALCYTVLAVVGARPISHLLVGDEFSADRFAVGSWCVLGIVNALTLPISTAATTVLPSRRIFSVRVVGSLLGLAAAVSLLALEGGTRSLPLGLAVGALLSGILMYRAASKRSLWTGTAISAGDSFDPPI